MMFKLNDATRRLPTDISNIVKDQNTRLKKMNEDFREFLDENRKNLP